MATGRNQKGMNRKNHHDHLSNSGQKSNSYRQPKAPKYTISDAIMGKKPPRTSITGARLGGNTTGSKKPYKSF